MLMAGLSEGGYIEHNEVKQLYYTDKILMDEKIKIKFDAHVTMGAIRVRSKLCRRPADMSSLSLTCNYTLEELLEFDPEEKVMQHVGSEEESPDHGICSTNKVLDQYYGTRNDNTAPCIYVIGVLGLSNYTSHYSIMVELEDDSGKNHPVVLSEGTPQLAEIKLKQSRYFMISIDDPKV